MPDHGPVTESHPVLRWARALLLAVVALAAGAVAHATAGGLMPGPGVMLILLLIGTMAAAALLGRPASTRKVVLLVMSGQASVHLALTALAGHAGDVRPSAPALLLPASGRKGASLYDQMMPTTPRAQLRTPDWVLHLVDDLTGPHAVMAIAHLAAAALVGLWLAAGEQALWSVVLLAVRPVAPEAAVVPFLPRLPVARRAVAHPRSPWLGAQPRRRGPPYSFAL